MTHVDTRIQAYLDGELTPPEASAFEAHVAACPRCRGELAAADAMWQAVDAAARPQLGRSLWPGLADQIQRRRAAERWTWTQRGLVLAAAAVGVVIGLSLGGDAPAGIEPDRGLDAAGTDYLQTSLPTLDQSWLQLGDLGEDTGS